MHQSQLEFSTMGGGGKLGKIGTFKAEITELMVHAGVETNKDHA